MVIGQTFLVVRIVSDDPAPVWLLDWYVYAAGGQDLLDRTLYREPLLYPGHVLPVSEFNLPPMAAVLAVPFLMLPESIAGVSWLAVGWASTLLATWWLTYRCLHLPHGWVWVGAVGALYAQTLSFVIHVSVANINDLMLGIVALFAVLHVRARHAGAGIVLGIAVATKVWPIAILAALVRQRRWAEVAYALATLVTVAVLFTAWAGPGILGEAANVIGTTHVNVTIDNPVLWTSWLRERTTWWPDWAAFVVAAALLAVPARGLPAVGLAILAGLSLVPNVWGHYFPTLAFATGLVATSLRDIAGGALRYRFPSASVRRPSTAAPPLD